MVDYFCRQVRVGDWVVFPVSRTIPNMSCGRVVAMTPTDLTVEILPKKPGYKARLAHLKHGGHRLLIVNKEYVDAAKGTQIHPRFYTRGSYPRYDRPFVRPFGFWQNDAEPNEGWYINECGVVERTPTTDQPREVSRTLPVVQGTRNRDGDTEAIPRSEVTDDDPEGMGWA